MSKFYEIKTLKDRLFEKEKELESVDLSDTSMENIKYRNLILSQKYTLQYKIKNLEAGRPVLGEGTETKTIVTSKIK